MAKEDRSDWVAVAPDASSTHEAKIAPPTTAYQYFQRLNSSLIKDELFPHNQKVDVGQLTKAVSSRFKSLTDSEKAKYESLAERDLRRYNAESAARDEAVLQRRLKSQREHAVDGIVEGRRHNRAAPPSSPAVRDRPRKKSGDGGNNNKTTESLLLSQRPDLVEAKQDQAKRRLEFLLKQSDIFSHFGNVRSEVKKKQQQQQQQHRGKNDADYDNDDIAQTASVVKRQPSKDIDEQDMDEQEEEREEADVHEATYLTTQPSTLMGTMRQYQLEGLNWMIRLQENGVNGILADGERNEECIFVMGNSLLCVVIVYVARERDRACSTNILVLCSCFI